MLTPELLLLTNQAVSSPHWQWRRGMSVIGPAGQHRGVVVDVNHIGVMVYSPKESGGSRLLQGDELPDLQDPATIGCLAHLVDEDMTSDSMIGTLVDLLLYKSAKPEEDSVS